MFRQLRYRIAWFITRPDYVVVPIKAFDNLCNDSKELHELKYGKKVTSAFRYYS